MPDARISPEDIARAHDRIAAHLLRTPVITTRELLPYPVEVKLEHLQLTGSFQARGAFTAPIVSAS